MPAETTPSSLENQPDLNEVLLSWKSPSHPFKKRGRIFYQTVFAFTFLLVAIVFFLHEFMLIGVILSIAFVTYVTSTVSPIEVEHKVTPLGFENAGRFFRWMEFAAFWFEEKWGYKMVVFQTRLQFPGQVRAVLSRDITEEQAKKIIGKYMLFLEKPPSNFVDNLSKWFSEKIPLETA
jgi:hypothetical protein